MGIDIVGSILGPVIGIVGGFLTRKQEIEKTKVDNEFKLKQFEHEVKLREAERISKHEANEDAMEMNREVTDSTLATTQLKGSYDGLIASINADAKQDGGAFWNAVRVSVRPVLTYISVGASIFMCYYAATQDIKTAAAYATLTNAGAAFMWWFGDRQAMKLNSKYLK